MKQRNVMIAMLAFCMLALQHHNHIHSARSIRAESTQPLSTSKAPAKDITLFPGNMLWDF